MLLQLGTIVSQFGAAAASQADCNASQNNTFFGLETWYKYLHVTFDPVSQTCKITNFDPNAANGGAQDILGAHSPFLLVGLAIIDDLLRVAALVAIGFVIAGGIGFITSQGSPDETTKARTMVINALIGLAIAIIAVGVVSFIGNRLGGP